METDIPPAAVEVLLAEAVPMSGVTRTSGGGAKVSGEWVEEAAQAAEEAEVRAKR